MDKFNNIMFHFIEPNDRIREINKLIKDKFKNYYFVVFILNEFMNIHYYPLDLVKQIFWSGMYYPIQMNATDSDVMIHTNNSEVHVFSNKIVPCGNHINNILKSNIKKIFFGMYQIITLDMNNSVFVWKYSPEKERVLLENIKDLGFMDSGQMYFHIYAITNDRLYHLRGEQLYYSPSGPVFGIAKIYPFWDSLIKPFEILLLDYGNRNGDILILTLGGELYKGDRNNCVSQIKIPGKIIDVKCGRYHNVALTEKYEVYTWGANDKKQLGLEFDMYPDPQKLNVRNIISICCYGDCTMLLSIDGTLHVYGET